MSKQFAIFTFRDTGPLKTWAAVRGAQVHNSREKPIAHGDPDGIRPKHEIGSGDLVRDIKIALRRHGIDPGSLRKNGVIAYEAVLTASPAFFQSAEPAERYERFGRWYRAQKQFLLEKYGEHRIVSMVLHLDEQTPHIHVVILPLEYRADGRSKDGGKRWALVGRTISGPGQFDRLQDEYARAMEPFDLSRGEVKSGRKHKPVREYLADLKRQEDENARRAAELNAEMERLRQQAMEATQEREAARKDRLAAAATKAAWEQTRAKVEAERATLEEDRRLLERLFCALDDSRQKAVHFMQMVKRIPENRWSHDALMMSKAAAEVTELAQPNVELLRAQMARLHLQGR